MRFKSSILIIAVLLAGSNFLAVHSAASQTPQEPSIAEAARINREQKKSVPKTAPVITNDTFGTSASSKPAAPVPAAATTLTTQPGENLAQSLATDAKNSGASAQPELSKEDADKVKAEIAAIKQELKDKQGEVELLQRLLNLDREAYYSKPDSSREADGKTKLDAEQDELAQKSQEFEKLKAKLQSIAPELTSAQAPPKP